MKTCPSCSSDQPDWALQCPACGATLAADPSPSGASADPGRDTGHPSDPGAYPPPGYTGPGYPSPGYPPPGYGAPGYAAPGYAAPGFPPPGYGASPGWAPAPAFGDPTAGAGRLAGWWHRVGATVIDGIILVVFESVVGAILGGGRLTASHGAGGGLVVARIIDLVAALAYQGLLLSRRGQTVGMMAVGTRIVDATSGGGIGVWRGVLRAVIEGLFAVLLLLPWVLDVLWPLWDRRNQTLHDKIVGTLILRTR